MDRNKKWWKTALKAALWFIGIWAALLVILQVSLSEKVLTKLANKYAAEYIDGDISFGSASVSMFKRFPRVFLSLDDFSITYPTDRFDAQEKMGAQGHLVRHGNGEVADTLASFKRFSASINVLSLAKGTIRIPHLRLVKPRIFAHSYANGDTNWDIFLLGEEEEEVEVVEDTTSTSLPNISLGRISLSRHPHIVYTDSRDTIFAMIDVARIGFNGKISTRSKISSRQKMGLTVDSLRIAGRVKKDTVAFSMQKFYIQDGGNHLDIDAKAKAMLATRSFGRIHLPIDISGELSFPRDRVQAVKLKDLKANIGDFPFIADAYVRFMEDRTGIQAKVGLNECRLNDIFHGFAKNIIPELEKVSTDARLTMLAECDGEYIHATGQLPELSATITLPEAELTYSDLEDLKLKIGVAASGSTDHDGKINAEINDIMLDTDGLHLCIKGGAKDLTGPDPSLKIDGKLDASLDTLATFLPDTLGITAQGSLAARLQGNALLSHLSIYNFSKADITGNVSGESLVIQMPSDTINVNVKGLDITLAPEDRVSRRDSTRKFRLIGVTATLDKADISYGNALDIKADNLLLSAKNSVSEDQTEDQTGRINPLSGRFKADRLSIRDAESTSLSLRETNNSFMLLPKKGQPKVPMLTLSSKNERITLSSGRNRAILTDANLRASAGMNTVERRQKAKAFRDSLALAHPEIPRDSLFAYLMSRREKAPIPEWMQEEDFKQQDIDIRLDETMAKYFRDWDLKGNIGVRTGIVMTPHFPLRNLLRGFELNFTNNEVKIDSFKVVSGISNLEAKGSLTGLKNALLGRGRNALRFNMDITSTGMDANELLTAYKKGMMYTPAKGEESEISDADLLQMVTSEDTVSVVDTTVPALIVVPANLIANVRLDASDVKYTDLVADKITSQIVMKERCIQITDTKAQTNMGEISFDAFYSSRSKKDLKAGFNLNFNDITADKVINLMPSIDTIMPLLKSFHGLLNCEVAATAALDTNMNLIMPSVNGILRISGDDLSITGSDMYRSLARKLLFKNKKEGHIESMRVEGMIKDNTLEVFPFIIEMDRYMLALSGVQNMDMSYRYHASLIKSPFLIKLGVDVYGDDFDNMKFKIGRAKYKNGNVPIFSAVIDQTKINLVKSIHNIFEKGVDAAFRENSMQSAILEHKNKIGYVRAVDVKLEELSADEQKQVEADEAAEAAAEAAENLPEETVKPEETNTDNQ